MKNRLQSFFDKKSMANISFVGVVINIAIFVVWFFADIGEMSFAIINLVDFDVSTNASLFFSTFLLLSLSFWIYFSARAKAKPALTVLAVFSFFTSFAYMGFGLFQPCFEKLFCILSIPFGGSAYSFDGIESKTVWVIFCILICILDKAVPIYLGFVALYYSKECKKTEEPENAEAPTEEKKPHKQKYWLIRIPLYLTLALTLFVSINYIADAFEYRNAERTELQPNYEDLLGSVNLYETINRYCVSRYVELYSDLDNMDMFSRGNSCVNCWGASDNQDFATKRLFTGISETMKIFDIDILNIGCDREEFLITAPLNCCSEAKCKYYSNGTDEEVIWYDIVYNKHLFSYCAVLVDNKLVYVYFHEQEEALLTSFGIGTKMKTVSEKEKGNKEYKKYTYNF